MKKPEKEKIVPKVTNEMKTCYERIEIPPKPTFKMREIPILILKRVAVLIEEYTAVEENTGGGLFYGTAGAGYTLLRCACYPLFEPIRERLLWRAKEYADVSMLYSNSKDIMPASFLLGKVGIYAVCAVIYQEMGYIDKAQECVHLFQEKGAHNLLLEDASEGGLDICNGRAGYLAAAIWLTKYFPEYFSTQFFYQHLDLIIESLRQYSKEIDAIQPFAYNYYDKQLIGILNGFSGVLFIILCFPTYIDKHPGLDEELKLSIDSILLRQNADGTFFPLMDSNIMVDEVLKWRNAAPGVIYLMAKAYLRWGHSRYYYSCILIGDLIWKYGLEFILTEGKNGSGIGLDHGLVGNIYGLLILYRLTKHTIYLQQAHVCSIPLKEEKHYKCFENMENVFSLFNGLCGALVYLLDLISIEKVDFPFLPVFDFYNEHD